MRVLVAGASGVVGTYLPPQLVERGHDANGTTTRPEKLDQIERAGAQAVLLDGLDAEAVADVVRQTQPEAIIRQMTALKGTPDFKRFDRQRGTFPRRAVYQTLTGRTKPSPTA